MVALFVVATITVFLVVDYFVYRGRKRNALSVRVTDKEHTARFVIPKGYFIGEGHTWVELLPNGTTRIGLDDFVQKIVGRIDNVTAARVGSEISKGDKLFSIAQGSRGLRFSSPISGRVIAANYDMMRHPAIVRKEPYKSGWVVVLDPTNLPSELKQLSIGSEAANRIKQELKRFRNFISSQNAIIPNQNSALPAGATLLDGGLPVNDVLEHSSQETWSEFEHDFLSAENFKTEIN